MSMMGNYISVTPADVEKIKADEGHVEELLDQSDGELALCIEKSWQAIHYVLNGDPWKGSGPLGNAVLGGRDVGEDMGYGPARFLTPDEVSETAKALDSITVAKFTEMLSKVNFEAGEVYVFSGEDPNDPDIVEELGGYYGDVRTFFHDAANGKRGMLLFLC